MAKKGSQLKRFKESLSTVIRPGQAKRKRKLIPEKDPERGDKLKRIEEQFNAFDTKFTRTKHEVFGRKVKGKVGKPGITRELGEQSRKTALLKERQRRNRTGGVIDRRFGENDPDMDPEERMLERFAREKQKRTRNSSLYNLEDDAHLTHFGQSLAEMDDYDQNDLLAVSDDDGDIKEDVVRQAHFGGNFDEQSDTENPTEERPRTKSEVMQELISKSKMYKHERQQQHAEDLEDIEALDAELGELQGLLRTIQPTPRERPQKTQEMLSYDSALREMVYDKRSKPTERIKTDEEVAMEEMERLHNLEEERLKRMRGEETEDVDGRNQRVRREGDDLDDDFVPDEEDADYYGLGKGATADKSDDEGTVEELADEDEMRDENEEDEEDEDEDEDEEIDDDFDLAQYFTDEEDNAVQEPEESEEDTIVPATKRLRIGDPSSTSKELAYTFPCPSTFEEMLNILNDVPISSIPTVIERIEILYSTKLLAENRQKLETFTPIVVQVILHLASQAPIPFNVITAIIVRLHTLATQFPSALTQEIFTAIEAGRKRLNQSSASGRVFPAAQELVLFYAIGQIYPTSDLFHVIVNPTTLFMAQILGQMRVKTIQDLARGLFICSLFLEYESLAKRVVPEVINFINLTLVKLVPVKADGLPETRTEIGTTLRLRASDMPKDVSGKLSFSSLYTKTPQEAQLKIQVFNMAIELVDAAGDLWKAITAFPELFHSTKDLFTAISKSKLHSSLPFQTQTRLHTVAESLTRRIKLSIGSRAALTLQAHRPIPIPSYLPRYKMSYSLDSKNDPDPERSGLSKLRAQHRREKKSVIRELRKEARTEAIVRSEEGKRRDQVYQEKMKVAIGIMKAGNAVGKWERDQKRKRR